VAKITVNGVEIEAQPGRRLVEVIKEQGITITNLCYIDGLEPYAGCRTCLVEIEGARPTPMQLSCTAQVAEGMVVTTDSPAIKHARQSVMSLIDANHSDRCLSCHRRVHCMPGDICLRDDVVTHRCLTCAKNYRCELQTSNELIDMGEFQEPWVGERRSYYESPPPEPDRANPFLEFDPQMCIICTRCVRACADLRHTDALSLAGKGFEARIAFGTGGPVHESDCDFCGACIDVCPTATLMEKPNKWVARADDWTNSVCNSCSIGCTISYGLVNDRQVIVRPDRLNPASRDQICVRGRFHYDAVTDRERLSRHLSRRGDNLLPVAYEDAVREAASAINSAKQAHGAGAIAVLGSPLASNEEAFLLGRLAREVIGTPHVDFSGGPVHRAVEGAFGAALGVDQRTAALADIEHARTIVAVARDLEESHPVVSLRIKDAVVKHGAKLILVSARWGELVPFAHAWLQPAPGQEAQAVQALAQAIAGNNPALGDPLSVDGADVPPVLTRAIEAVRAGAASDERFAVVFAPVVVSASDAAAQAAASANLAIAACGDDAAANLHYLPTDANVIGIVDAGIAPGQGGKSFPEIIAAAQAGEIRALVIHRDNPLLSAPGTPAIEAALAAVEALIVIDSLRSTASEHASVLLAEQSFQATIGSTTSADRRVALQRHGTPSLRDERPGAAVIEALANALGASWQHASPFEITDEIAASVEGYPHVAALDSGRSRALRPPSDGAVRFQPVPPPAEAAEGLALFTNRPLYHSWDGSSIRSPEADKLHREESVILNPRDAQEQGIRTGDDVVLTDGTSEVRITAKLDDGVAPGTAYVPQYYDGGTVLAFFPLEGATAGPTVGIRVRALQPA